MMYNVAMRQVMDETVIRRALVRIAHEIVEQNKKMSSIVLIGVNNKGEYLAKLLCEQLKLIEGKSISWCGFDTTYFRDDVDARNLSPDTLLVNVVNKTVILVDDMLSTGRTARAAIDGVMHFGRPKAIQLVALIDCGKRELPIRADYVGKNIPVAIGEKVVIKLQTKDNSDGVYIKG